MFQNINQQQNKNLTTRPPVVVIMGHIDHGKTTLLDYIRKENVAESESGGITQHIGAYEAAVNVKEGGVRKITFIDTPGHEAFSKMRSRGAKIADLAVLVVAADDSVKAQTKEAIAAINSAGLPFVVAINKIDKDGANIEKIKKDLAENNVLIEEWGGKIPVVPISAKTGQGVEDLLEIILIASDLEDLKADPASPASGVVVESHLDIKRGNTATLIIQNGTLRQGEFLAAGQSVAPVRIFEDFAGHAIKEALPGQPVRVTGFNILPQIGTSFESFVSKKEAEKSAAKLVTEKKDQVLQAAGEESAEIFEIPVIIKADTAGSAEAVEGELRKLESEKLRIKILRLEAGPISEDDMKLASGSLDSIIVGFKVKTEKIAPLLAERFGVRFKTFDLIYEIADWLKEEIQNILPEKIIEKEMGQVKVLRIFKQSAKDQIIGGRVISGEVFSGKKFRIKRRAHILGAGKIQELEQNKTKTSRVEEGKEFGMKVVSKIALAEGDELEIVEEEKIRQEI